MKHKNKCQNFYFLFLYLHEIIKTNNEGRQIDSFENATN